MDENENKNYVKEFTITKGKQTVHVNIKNQPSKQACQDFYDYGKKLLNKLEVKKN